MKKLILFFIILFAGMVLAEGLKYPKIASVKYHFQYRKTTSEFVDFNYLVEIQGAHKNYKMLLEIELYNIKEECIYTFKDIISIENDKLQTFEGSKLLPINLADNTEFVGAKLKLLEKKY